MTKIIYFEREINLNFPAYSFKLLNSLKSKGLSVNVVYANDDFARLTEDLSKTNFIDLYGNFPNNKLENLENFKNLINQIQPTIFLVQQSSSQLTRDLMKYIRKKNIYVFEIDQFANGVLAYYYKEYIPFLDSYWLKYRLHNYLKLLQINRFFSFLKMKVPFSPTPKLRLSNHMSLKGPWFYEKLIKNYPKNTFTITGSCLFDYFKQSEFSKSDIFKQINLDMNRKIIIICPILTKHSSNREIKYLSDCINQLKKLKDYKLYFKLHPREFFEKNITHFLPYNIPLLENNLFYDTLKYTSFIFSPASTIGLESSLCDVPILTDDFYPSTQIPYHSNGYKVGCKVNANNILSIIKDCENGKIIFDYKKFNESMNYKNDGKAYERISKKVSEIIHNNYE